MSRMKRKRLHGVMQAHKGDLRGSLDDVQVQVDDGQDVVVRAESRHDLPGVVDDPATHQQSSKPCQDVSHPRQTRVNLRPVDEGRVKPEQHVAKTPNLKEHKLRASQYLARLTIITIVPTKRKSHIPLAASQSQPVSPPPPPLPPPPKVPSGEENEGGQSREDAEGCRPCKEDAGKASQGAQEGVAHMLPTPPAWYRAQIVATIQDSMTCSSQRGRLEGPGTVKTERRIRLVG